MVETPATPPGWQNRFARFCTDAVRALSQRLRFPAASETSQAGWANGRLKRIVKPCLYVTIPVILLSAFTVGIVYVRLLQGPVSLIAFKGLVEAGISAELGDLTASIDDVQLTFSKQGGFECRMIGIKLTGPDGEIVASAPLAALELSGAALRTFKVAPKRIDLIEPHLALFYSRESGISLSLASASDRAAAGDGLAVAKDGHAGKPQAAVQALPDSAVRGLIQSPLPLSAVTPPVEGGQAAADAAAVSALEPTARPMPLASLRRIDLARVLAKHSAHARRGSGASSYLRQLGLRDAKVSIDYTGKLTEWRVQELEIDLEHLNRRSVISGMARVDSARGPWVMTFVTEDSDKTRDIKVKASLRDLVPSALGQGIPEFSWLQTLNLPVAGDAAIELSTAGILKSATLALELGRGEVVLPALSTPLALEAGLMQISYDATQRVFSLSPSTLKWGGSHMTVAGDMTGVANSDGQMEWRFALKSTAGALVSGDAAGDLIPIDRWLASGRLVPHDGLLELTSLDMQAGGGQIALQGEMTASRGPSGAKLSGQISPMPLTVFKALWPQAVAPGARRWVADNILGGNPGAGTLTLASGRYLEGPYAGQDRSRLSFAIEATDLQLKTAQGVAPIEAPRALLRLENDGLEVAIPDASIAASSGKKIPLKGGQFSVTGLSSALPEALLTVKSQTALAPLIDVLVKAGVVPKVAGEVPVDAFEGKADAAVEIRFPLMANVRADSLVLSGKALLSDIKCKQKIKGLDLTGGSIAIDASGTSIQAKGDILVNGVQIKLDGQRLVEAEPGKQPPLRLNAVLDNADRIQLGLDINHLVQGDMPVEITVTENPDGTPKVEVRSDLTNADVGIADLAWRKPPGRAAFAQFEIGKGKGKAIELQNFRVAGDNIAIEGWLSMDESNEVREFYFPDFSANVVTRLEVRGKLGADKIWKINAKGATFDGRDLFRSLVSISAADGNRVRPLRPSAGLDLEADIGTILGHSDVALRKVSLRLSDRDDKLTALQVDGTLDGGKPLKVLLRQQQGQGRIVYADATDAGQALRLVGFYPNMQNGRVRLEVNLEGKGAATKTGLLYVDNFKVLGDPIVAEVFSNAPDQSNSDGKAASKKVAREEFYFDSLRVPFSAGHGQFVMEESYLRGPVLGATVRGKIDHITQRLSLGGTYVPLQGINSALCGVPIVGQIITGIKCEGLLGITYAIQGPIAKPQVVVNPFSMVAPGIFREIFQMTNPDPKVLARDEPQRGVPVESRVRASSSATVSGGDATRAPASARPAAAETIDGWSSQTSPNFGPQ